MVRGRGLPEFPLKAAHNQHLPRSQAFSQGVSVGWSPAGLWVTEAQQLSTELAQWYTCMDWTSPLCSHMPGSPLEKRLCSQLCWTHILCVQERVKTGTHLRQGHVYTHTSACFLETPRRLPCVPQSTGKQ
jgi:hypothetical protein